MPKILLPLVIELAVILELLCDFCDVNILIFDRDKSIFKILLKDLLSIRILFYGILSNV